MRTATKLGLYGAVLGGLLAAGIGLGAAVGPIDGRSDDAVDIAHDEPAHDEPAGGHATAAPAAADDLPAGLSASRNGYTFAPEGTTFAPGVSERFTFRIMGTDGRPVEHFDVRHEQRLHLVVVSDDLTDYQHLHPTLSEGGTWSIELELPRAGGYRAYADFAPAGVEPMTLGVDLPVSGAFEPRPLPAPAAAATVDGYEVRLDGALRAGADGELRFSVTRAGEPVDDLEPYLGAYGHLVAIRAADHAYLHVHPTEDASPREVAFVVGTPSPGTYRLFLDFQHDATVRTAAFTIDVPAATASAAQDAPTVHDEGSERDEH